MTDRQDRASGAMFRKDGWPLCPRCGEDELYCLEQAWDLSHDHRTPPCPIMRCYRCNWTGEDQRPGVYVARGEA